MAQETVPGRGIRSASSLALLIGFALLPMILACRQSSPVPSPHPNILLVSIDTLRSDHLSAYGYHRRTSPNLETFCDDAALFENAYAQFPFTLESHMSMLTSLFPGVHGVNRKRGLDPAIPTLPQFLAHSGYRTIGFYSLDWLDPAFGFDRGFDRYERTEDGHAVRKAALEFLRGPATAVRDRPFFLFVHIRDVHCGPGLQVEGIPLYNSPVEYRDAFLPYPEVGNRHLAIDLWEERAIPSEQELANIVAQYDGGILYADALVGDILAQLREAGLYGESLIVITSDHGESLGARNKFSHGGVWEEGLRVPLLIKLPRSHPEQEQWQGVRLAHRVQSVDLAPTLLRIAGLPIPPGFQGRDLFDPADRDIIAQSGLASVFIRGDYKLRMDARLPGDDRQVEMVLYDLARDPGETTPVQSSGPARKLRAALRSHLWTHLQEHRKRVSVPSDAGAKVELSAEQRERLQALGYVEQ